MLQANRTTILFLAFTLAGKILFAQPGNNLCASATNLTPVTSCGATSGQTLYLSTATGSPTSLCGATNDVWYTFTVPAGVSAVNIDVTPTGGGSNLDGTNTFIEAFNSTTCAGVTTLNTLGCNSIGSTVSYTGLAPSTLYYFRVFTTATPTSTPSGKWVFSVCVSYTAPPANDDCSGAITLSNGVTNNAGSVWIATASSDIPIDCASGDPDDDVWYKFTPSASILNISLSSIGSNLSASGARLQLFSGTCEALTSLSCGTTSITRAVTSGTTYHIRVYSAGTGSIGGTASGSAFSITATATAPVLVSSGRMKEVYQQTILSGANLILDPWEITYGPDNYLWITEAKGYKVFRMDPSTGNKTTVLDISQGSTFLPSPDNTNFNCTFNNGSGAQGGLAGLALHPKFLDASAPENYVYISYIRSQTSSTVFTNRVVRFTYNTGTGLLESPVSLCDTIPGSSDHNSQRMIIAPVGGTHYLFYASGDMGAGQFGNVNRTIKSQFTNSYEGKILRFNLVEDTDPGPSLLDKWIPNDNPFNATLGVQSAVWATGMRNNQGFAYDTALNILYGSSHGPFSDDEVNIIEQGKNYGHPLVIGYAADDNANGTTAGAAPNMSPGHPSSCPVIVDESNNAATIGATYKDPLFAAYPSSTAFPSLNTLWNTTSGANAQWPSEGWSGLDLYTHTIVPGWKKSLIAASLKWGRLVKIKLGPGGTTVIPTNGADTVSYFGSTNRFRDVAFAPNGKDLYVIMDRSATSSGPSASNPIVPACAGCVQKYTFLGYADGSGKSTIPTAIDVTDGTVNTCNTGTTVTIDDTNNSIWVPITGPDGNIMAEIYANGQNLGTITSSFYKHSGSIRVKNGVRYLDRNIAITPATQPASAVKLRLYFSKAEFDALDLDPASGVTSIGDIKILKNSDPCGSSISAATTLINPQFSETHGANGYMLQSDNITSFSSFYFASSNITLPVELITFTGSLQSNITTLLKWKTANEMNTSLFVVERSIDGTVFNSIGSVAAGGVSSSVLNYTFVDNDVANQPSLIIYYRLKMVDADGAFRYSSIITIMLSDITGIVTVTPVPVKTQAKVSIAAPAEGIILYKMIDNTGRILLQRSAQVRKGPGNTINIDMSRFAPGTYYLNISGAGMDENIKLQKL